MVYGIPVNLMVDNSVYNTYMPKCILLLSLQPHLIFFELKYLFIDAINKYAYLASDDDNHKFYSMQLREQYKLVIQMHIISMIVLYPLN